MKLSLLAAMLVVLCISEGCHKKNAANPFFRMEAKAQPFYCDYFDGSPEVSLAGIRKVEQIAFASSPEVWEYLDRGTYMAFVHGRLSLASAKIGKTNEAKYYRAIAVRDFRLRKVWSNKYQTM